MSIRDAFPGDASVSIGRFGGSRCLMANRPSSGPPSPPAAPVLSTPTLSAQQWSLNAPENERAAGNAREKAVLDALAGLLAMPIVGVSALLRTKATPEQMHAVRRGATSRQHVPTG